MTKIARFQACSLVISLALALGAPIVARADEPLDPVAQEAQQSFAAGREAVKKGELGRAVELFKHSQELKPTPGTLLNLASVEEQLGKLTAALMHFKLALTELPAGDDRLPVATDAIARLTPRTPSLRIDLAVGAVMNMRIKLDGASVATSSLGADQPLDPGNYEIVTQTPGHEDRRYEIKLIEGAHLTVAVEAGKEIAPRATVAAPPMSRRSSLQSVGFVAGGVGLAGLGLGAVTGILAIGKKGDAATLCPDPTRCGGEGRDVAGTGHALAAVSTASFVMGAVGVAAGVTLVLLGRDRAPAPAAARVIVNPLVLPGGAGLGASGSF